MMREGTSGSGIWARARARYIAMMYGSIDGLRLWPAQATLERCKPSDCRSDELVGACLGGEVQHGAQGCHASTVRQPHHVTHQT